LGQTLLAGTILSTRSLGLYVSPNGAKLRVRRVIASSGWQFWLSELRLCRRGRSRSSPCSSTARRRRWRNACWGATRGARTTMQRASRKGSRSALENFLRLPKMPSMSAQHHKKMDFQKCMSSKAMLDVGGGYQGSESCGGMSKLRWGWTETFSALPL